MSNGIQDYILKRSFTFKLLNGVIKSINQLGINFPDFNREVLLSKAKKQTGIDLPIPVETALQRLLDSIKNEAGLNGFGKIAVHAQLIRLLKGRLQIENTIRLNPQILDEKIEKPVFIIGLPRTGTTILHALLHEDPANRSPLCWECLEPHPVPDLEYYYHDDRIKLIEDEFSTFFKLVPGFQKMHLMSATTPQECIGIHTYDFKSFQFLAQMHLPSYLKWMEDEDSTSLYNFHKKMLQYLQSGGVKGKRWLLKSPVHLNELEMVLRIYPDAQFIIPHRHPKHVISSVTSLMTSVRSLYSDQEDSVRTAQEQLTTWSNYLNHFVEIRHKNLNTSQFYEMHFDDFIADPLISVKSIYKFFGWNLSSLVLSKMEKYMENNPKDRHGKHEYTLHQFGLDDIAVNNRFSKYIEYINGKFSKSN